MNDDGFLEFVEAWNRELHGSEREHEYLKFIMSEAGYSGSDPMSVAVLRQMLTHTIELVSTPPPRISHPVAAFELVTIVDGFSQAALGSLPKAVKGQLETELTGVSGSVIIFAFQAVDQHFRADSRLKGN